MPIAAASFSELPSQEVSSQSYDVPREPPVTNLPPAVPNLPPQRVARQQSNPQPEQATPPPRMSGKQQFMTLSPTQRSFSAIVNFPNAINNLLQSAGLIQSGKDLSSLSCEQFKLWLAQNSVNCDSFANVVNDFYTNILTTDNVKCATAFSRDLYDRLLPCLGEYCQQTQTGTPKITKKMIQDIELKLAKVNCMNQATMAIYWKYWLAIIILFVLVIAELIVICVKSY